MGEKCPHCQGEALITGKIYNQIDYVNPPAFFRPVSSPIFAIFKNVQLQNSFQVCSFCGFLWSKIDDSERLQQFISTKGAV